MSDSPRVMHKDDLFELQWLQGAEFSPDGRQVVYTRSHVDAQEEQEYTTIYVLDVASGTSRQMTAGKQRVGSATFSPDGKTIAFVSDRAEKNQIYLLPVDGGEARQLTELKQGANNPVWSPDGSKMAFTAGIDWGEDGAPDRSKQPYRVTRSVWRFDAIGDLDLAVSNVYVIDVESGEVKQLTDSNVISGGLKWAPDGSRLLFAATMHPERFKSIYPTLRIVDLDGKVAEIAKDWGIMGAFHWLPGGDGVVFIGRPDDGAAIGTHSHLWLYNLQSATFENRTPSMELGIGSLLSGRSPTMGLANIHIRFSEDGKAAFVRVQERGTVQIYRIALSGAEQTEVAVGGERTCNLQDLQRGRLLYVVDDINHTPDLYSANLDGSDERRLTHINDEFLSKIILPQYENLHFKGSDGVDVEGWYVQPTTDADGPYPTILWIHGGPHAAQGNRYSFDTHMFAGAGYGVLFINHRASTGYGNAFSTAIKGDWGNLDYKDLMAGVDYAIDRGLADPDKLGCCGISGGGNLSSWIIGNTDRFKAAVPQNPVTNWLSFYGVSDIGVYFSVEELGGHPHEIPEIYRKCSPVTYAHNCTTPTLIIQCEHDWRCPAEQSEQFYTVLRANGCTVEMLRHPGGSHGGSINGPVPLRKSHLQARLGWFNKYILGIAAQAAAQQTQEAPSRAIS